MPMEPAGVAVLRVSVAQTGSHDEIREARRRRVVLEGTHRLDGDAGGRRLGTGHCEVHAVRQRSREPDGWRDKPEEAKDGRRQEVPQEGVRSHCIHTHV